MKRQPFLATALLAVAPLTAAADSAAPAPTLTAPPCPGVDTSRVAPLVRHLFDAEAGETRAALLVVDGCPAVKAYAPGYGDANRFLSWSMAKTLTGFTVGALVQDGRLALDAPVPLAEWHGPGDPRGSITLRQMMQMRSGLAHVEVGDPVERSDTNQILFVSGTQAMAKAAAGVPLAQPPGRGFVYSSLTSLLLAEIVTRRLTASPDPHSRAGAYRDFAMARVYAPAGARPVLEFDGSGTQIGGSIIHMTLDEWGRVGALLFDGRAANGRQVIAPAWLAFMKTPSPVNPEYGGQLWTRQFAEEGFAGTVVAMLGHLGQRVIAAEGHAPGTGAPRRVLIVRLGNTREDRDALLHARLGAILAALLARP